MNDIRHILENDSRPSGLVKNMDRSEYDGIPRLNGSSLSKGLMPGSDVDIRAVRDSFGKNVVYSAAKQDQLDCGTLGHIALIQPQRLVTDVAIWTGKIRSGNAWSDFQHTHAGKLIVREDDYNEVMADVQQLRSRETVAKYVRDVDAEVAVFANEDGLFPQIFCKGLIDIIDVDKKRIVDVKFTEAGIAEHKIKKTMRDLWYREKMALYRRWVAMATKTDKNDWKCWNLFLSRSGSLGIHEVPYTTAALEWGEARMLNVMVKVSKCLKSGEWPMLELESFADVAMFEMDDEIEVGDGN